MAGDSLLSRFYNILRNYSMSNFETLHQISTGEKVHFSLPFKTTKLSGILAFEGAGDF